MYVNHWQKDAQASGLADLMEMQTRNMEASYDRLTTSERSGPARKDDRTTGVRIASYDDNPFKEITGYIDCEGFVAFFVLFTIPELEAVNTRKLMHVLKYSVPFEIEFDNRGVIIDLKNKIDSVDDPVEKAAAYTQIGIWYAEMRDRENSARYFRRSFGASPTVYRNFRPLIAAELADFRFEAAAECARALFRLGPENPRAMQDILEVYEIQKHDEALRGLVRELGLEHDGNREAQVNIGFHYGMRLVELQFFESAERTLLRAQKAALAISREHPALPGIGEMLTQTRNQRDA